MGFAEILNIRFYKNSEGRDAHLTITQIFLQ